MAAGMRGQVSNFGIIHRKPDGQLVAQSFGLLRIAGVSKASRQLEASFLFLFPASMPSSMSSTRIRLSLKRWLFAMRSTCLAMGVGSDTLRRTCFVVGMASLYTNWVHTDADTN